MEDVAPSILFHEWRNNEKSTTFPQPKLTQCPPWRLIQIGSPFKAREKRWLEKLASLSLTVHCNINRAPATPINYDCRESPEIRGILVHVQTVPPLCKVHGSPYTQENRDWGRPSHGNCEHALYTCRDHPVYNYYVNPT